MNFPGKAKIANFFDIFHASGSILDIGGNYNRNNKLFFNTYRLDFPSKDEAIKKDIEHIKGDFKKSCENFSNSYSKNER